MELIMDMVHDNPGEARTKTVFRQPETLLKLGYNTQIIKNISTIVDFSAMGEDFFPTPESKQWLQTMTDVLVGELTRAKAAGMMVMSHIDLFVLPKAMVDAYADALCDENGKITVWKEKTKEVHRVMLDELFGKFGLDGLIIRVGETYLHDTPFHTGNGAVPYGDILQEKEAFVELLNFLREEVCQKHGKYLIFRTWDCKPDRFHADDSYYLDVTDRIAPHEKLIFSIKHTALDFWRNVRFNPCLTIGKHRQVVEVQCQREYEGKCAYPSYVMDGIINGFPENALKKGLKDIMDDPHICGIYTWSRGGGWFGPYIQNEFWCELNTYVISAYACDHSRTEEEIFLEFAQNRMQLTPEDAKKFHTLCQKVQSAVLHGRYITAYDRSLNERRMPSLWTRDDRIGGLRQLNKVFDYLEPNGLVEEALAEKELALTEWEEIAAGLNALHIPDPVLGEFIRNSGEYAVRLYRLLLCCFRIFAKCRKLQNVRELLLQYDRLWAEYKELEGFPQASSSYCDQYIFSPDNLGLNETIAYCRQHLADE